MISPSKELKRRGQEAFAERALRAWCQGKRKSFPSSSEAAEFVDLQGKAAMLLRRRKLANHAVVSAPLTDFYERLFSVSEIYNRPKRKKWCDVRASRPRPLGGGGWMH